MNSQAGCPRASEQHFLLSFLSINALIGRTIFSSLIFLLAISPASASQAKTATTTVLAVTASGSATSSVPYGTKVTLTATVTPASGTIAAGQVNFCDGGVTYCAGIHIIGTTQITSAGTATINLHPAPGSYSYEAVFVGTTGFATSTSSVSSLTVTGKFPTITQIAASVSPGDYTVTATVNGSAKASAAPTGTISFLDTTASNAVLGTADLGNASTVLLGNVANTVIAPYPYLNAGRVVAGDFNGDGNQDVAFGGQDLNANSLAISVMLGDGTGNFALAKGSPIDTVGYPQAVEDFNGDGYPDILMGGYATTVVSVLLGNGDGTFRTAPGSPFSTTYGNSSEVAADFNGDGIPDFAAGNGSELVVYLGKGDGSFQAPLTTTSSPAGVSIEELVAGDFNNDGIPDLAGWDFDSGSAILYLGKGDGTFQSGTVIFTPTNGKDAYQILMAAGDFNGDGNLDLAVPVDLSNSQLGILLGNGDGTFRQPIGSPITLSTEFTYAAVGDFNGDGIPDLFMTGPLDSSPDSAILLGNGDGTFTLASGTAPQVTCCEFSNPAMIDINGDRLTDAVLSSDTTGAAQVFLAQDAMTTVTANGINAIGPGTDQVVVQYPGDGNYTGSTSTSVGLTGLTDPPAFSLPAGIYTSTQQVKVSDATPNSDIFYTTDGSTPRWGYGKYFMNSGTISVSASETIQAIAGSPGDFNSTLASATYTIVSSAPVPSVSGISTTSTAAGSAGFPLTVNGANFANTSMVMWGSTALTTTYVSATQLTAQVPASLVATEGTVSVTVQTPAPGGGTSNANTFTINALVPSISGILPATTTAGSVAFPLTVNGANFTSASTVMWGTTSLTTQFVSATALTAQVPASLVATEGTVSVTVQTPAPGGGTSNANTFTINALVPSIGSIAPVSTVVGSAAFPLTVNGANFTSASTVMWGTTALTTQFVSATQLTAQVTATLVASAGTASVTVQTPAPGGGTSNASSFEIDSPVPSISSIAPATTTTGSVAFPLTVNGANFTSASTVMWGSTALTTQYVSATQLTGQVPALLVASAGTVSVTVQTPAPGGGTSNANTFTVNAPVPSISSIAPASTVVGSAAFPLTVNGTNFTSASTVMWGSTALTTQYVSATQLTGQVPALLVASAGTASVTVQTPAPGGGTSNANTFTINALVPSISGILPATTTAGSAAFPLTVKGANFTSASTVLWGSTSLTTQYMSAAQLTAQVPASLVATEGTDSVTVQTPAPGGGTSNANTFTINALVPSISSIAPASTAMGSAAFPLTVNGANFTSASTVMWGSTALTTQYVSATQLTAQVTATLVASAGTASVTVQTPAPGGGTSNASNFSIYVPALVPSVSGISPATATAGSAAFTLTVNGANFTSASTVLWGTTSLTTQYVSATELTAAVPALLIASAGTDAVTVQTPAPGGGTSNPYTFEIDTAGSTTPPTFSTVTVTVTAGTPATYPVTLPSTATSVSVTCLNLPAYATCSYSASTGALTVNTTASTPAGTYVVTAVFTETLPGAASSIILLPLFLVPFAGKRKRKKAGVLLLALVGLAIAVSAAGIGCGGGGGSSVTITPTTHIVTSSGTVTLVVH